MKYLQWTIPEMKWCPSSQLVALFLSCLLFLGCTQEYEVWYSPGPVQVLANSDEAWFFIQLNRDVRHPQSFLGWDVPSVYPIGHEQEVLVIKKDGTFSRLIVKGQNGRAGVSFNSSSNNIFYKDGQFQLFHLRSANYKESLFIWDTDRFLLLPSEQGVSFAAEFSTDLDWPSSKDLNKLTEQHGWSRVFAENFPYDEPFTVFNHPMKFDLQQEDDAFTIQISSTLFPPERSPIELHFEREYRVIKRKEYKNLPRSGRGHPK